MFTTCNNLVQHGTSYISQVVSTCNKCLQHVTSWIYHKVETKSYNARLLVTTFENLLNPVTTCYKHI